MLRIGDAVGVFVCIDDGGVFEALAALMEPPQNTQGGGGTRGAPKPAWSTGQSEPGLACWGLEVLPLPGGLRPVPASLVVLLVVA